jgi:hypothetical protein
MACLLAGTSIPSHRVLSGGGQDTCRLHCYKIQGAIPSAAPQSFQDLFSFFFNAASISSTSSSVVFLGGGGGGGGVCDEADEPPEALHTKH